MTDQMTRLQEEAEERYPIITINGSPVGHGARRAFIAGRTISADWETIVAAMKDEAQNHHIEENLNLGQYRTKYLCSCGEEWTTDGHDTAHPQRSFGDHCRRMEARAALEAAGMVIEDE